MKHNPVVDGYGRTDSMTKSGFGLTLKKRAISCFISFTVFFFGAGLGFAETPSMSVYYQPMVSTGLAAAHPHESWFVFDKWSDPHVPGHAIPAGATIRFTFPEQFKPVKRDPLGAVMLYGWSQKPIPVKFTTQEDPSDPRVVLIKFQEPISVGNVGAPGLKAIHLRTSILNPEKEGHYPIDVEFVDAGTISGKIQTVASITPKPVPNVASYNSLHESRNENWQRVKPGQETQLPIDFLVNLPDSCRSFISLRSNPDGNLTILSDGKPIGSVIATGVPVTMRPEPFGPGQARLGIIRVHVKGGSNPGLANIVASLDGGTQYTITVVVE